MIELLTAALATIFVAYVVVDSGTIGHYWRLLTRQDTPGEFWQALSTCRLCMGFWLSIPIAVAAGTGPAQLLAVNGAHLAYLVVEGYLWPSTTPDDVTTDDMVALPATVEVVEAAPMIELDLDTGAAS